MIKVSYENSLINLAASLLKHYNAFIEYKTLKVVDEYLNKGYNHVILMVLDGLGINIIKAHLDENDGLRKNIKHVANSVFPPTTVAATNAILSGKPSFVSGFVGWMQYNQFADAHEVVFFGYDYYDANKIVSPQLQQNFLKYENILDKIKKKNEDLHVEVVFPSFHKTNGYETFDDQLNRLLMITQKKKSFTYCYSDQPDLTIHQNGIYTDEVKRCVKSINASYERFLREIKDDVLVIVTADHGLIDVEPIKLYNYNDVVKTFIRKPALEARATAFFVKEEEKKNFEKLFKKYFKDDFLLLSREELYETNLLGYGVKNSLLDSFIGDYLAIAVKNKMFVLCDREPFKAHHAGLTKEELEIPIIINR